MTIKEFDWTAHVIKNSRKKMLLGKDEALTELYRLCDTECQVNLIADLLRRYEYFDEDDFGVLLHDMVEYVLSLGYPPEETVFLAMPMPNDKNTDSSHHVLYEFAYVIDSLTGFSYKTYSEFLSKDSLVELYKAGYRHFIAIDDFAGSGGTVSKRYKHFQNISKGIDDVTVNFCIGAGMVKAEKRAQEEGIPIKILYPMNKGISEEYKPQSALQENIEAMIALEAKLAERIKRTKLSTYTFGFGQCESIFTRHRLNIPNNVFPIFWWKEYKDNKPRVHLFNRTQSGY